MCMNAMWRPEIDTGYLPLTFSTVLFFHTVFLIESEACQLARLAGQLPYPSRSGADVTESCYLAWLSGCWRYKLRSLSLHGWHLPYSATASAPLFDFSPRKSQQYNFVLSVLWIERRKVGQFSVFLECFGGRGLLALYSRPVQHQGCNSGLTAFVVSALDRLLSWY